MLDKITVEVKAGDGGEGSVSFRREKYVPFGGPDGGDGGNGGEVLLVTDKALSDLRNFKKGRLYRAESGGNGRGKNMHGRKGPDLVLRVPVGTVAWEQTENGEERIIFDGDAHGQQEVVAKGGRGGYGNTHYVTSTNQTPMIAQKGTAGENKSLRLELRLIADVGIIGFPNAGKSTLLSQASAARPKIASYPFTTLEPILGVVEIDHRTFVLAEIPGLIEGAHLGRGIGHEFLRHIMRTRILIHLVDGSSEDPVKVMAQVNTELSQFDPVLARKQQIVVVNKIDIPEAKNRLDELQDEFREVGTDVIFVSAYTGEGVSALMNVTMKMLTVLEKEEQTEQKALKAVFRPQPKDTAIDVSKEGDVFIVHSSELERIVNRVDTGNQEVVRQLQGQIARLGVKKALEKAGVEPGDKVRCGGFQWEW